MPGEEWTVKERERDMEDKPMEGNYLRACQFEKLMHSSLTSLSSFLFYKQMIYSQTHTHKYTFPTI